MASLVLELHEQGTRAWINAQLAQMDGGAQHVDVQLYTLLRKLELLADDMESSVQSTNVQLVRAMPQAVRDVESLQETAAELRASLSALSTELAELEIQSDSSLGLLVEAEHVKRRMGLVSETLEQAQHFAHTLGAAEAALEAGDAPGAASRLAKSRAGLGSLESVPRFRDARARVDALSARLESSLQPRLVGAVRERDAALARECVGVLEQLGRAESAADAFVATRQGPLLERWNAHAHASEAGFGAWLPSFHAAVLADARADAEWARAAGFRGARALVGRALVEALGAIAAQCAERLCELARGAAAEGAAEPDGGRCADGLERVVTLAAASRAWGAELSRAVCADGGGGGAGSDGGGAAGAAEQLRTALALACDAPWARVRARWAELEQPVLAGRLRALPLPSAGGAAALSAALAAALPRALAELGGATRRCAALSGADGGADADAAARAMRAAIAAAHVHEPPVGAQLGAALGRCYEAAVAERCEALLGALASALGLEGAGGAPAGARGWAHFGDVMRALCALHEHAAQLAALAHGAAAELGAPALGEAPCASARALEARARALALGSAFAPIEARIGEARALDVWSARGGASAFSASALPYMTAIGEHLLLLPQALEPYSDHGALRPAPPPGGRARERAEGGGGGAGAEGGSGAGAEGGAAIVAWLEQLCARAVDALLGLAAGLRELSPAGERQLCADAGYLRMVVASGLGLDADPRLGELERALGDGGLEQQSAPGAGLPAEVARGLERARRAHADAVGPAAAGGQREPGGAGAAAGSSAFGI